MKELEEAKETTER